MNTADLQKHYQTCIGDLSRADGEILCFVKTTRLGGQVGVGVELGVRDMGGPDRREREAVWRKACHRYFKPFLGQGESMRCWFGIRGNPRVDLFLRREPGVMDGRVNNDQIKRLIEIWAGSAKVDLS